MSFLSKFGPIGVSALKVTASMALMVATQMIGKVIQGRDPFEFDGIWSWPEWATVVLFAIYFVVLVVLLAKKPKTTTNLKG